MGVLLCVYLCVCAGGTMTMIILLLYISLSYIWLRERCLQRSGGVRDPLRAAGAG